MNSNSIRNIISDSTFFSSFDRWFENWNVTTNQGLRLGLLHDLQTRSRVYEEERSKMIPFLLDLADGYLLEAPPSYTLTPRKELSLKVFAVLCTIFFDGNSSDDPKYETRKWWWMLSDEEVFKKVIWFFRFESHFIHNCKHPLSISSGEHYQHILLRFLREFTHLSWENRNFSFPTTDFIISCRPQMIEISSWFGELSYFFGKELDQVSVEKFKEIALRNKLYFPPEKVGQKKNCREPKNLDEAVLGGSQAACVLAIHEKCQEQRVLFEKRYNDSWSEVKKQKEEKDQEERRRRLLELEKECIKLKEV